MKDKSFTQLCACGSKFAGFEKGMVEYMNDKLKINKERTWVYSPTPNIVIKTTINAIIHKEELQTAINKAADANEILSCCIVFDSNHEAYYKPQTNGKYFVEAYVEPWQEVALNEAKEPFRPEQGNLIRVFYSYKEGKTELLLIAHHLMGDGISYAYLVQDIMRALTGKDIETKPIELFQMEDLPRKSKLTVLMRVMMKGLNKKFSKTGKVFTSDEHYNMAKRYHENVDTHIVTKTFSKEEYVHMKELSKRNDVTLNTVIITALLKAANNNSDIGHAVSIRRPGYEGMGNFATGVSTQNKYDCGKSFFENAHMVQDALYKKLRNEKKKYFLLQFMGGITGSLQDAIYFAACDGYENKTAKQLASMFGYLGNPKGISVTNLTKLPIQGTYGDLQLLDFTFVPPLVLNSQRIIGIATIGETMTATLQIKKDEKEQENLRFFKEAMEVLCDSLM